MPGTKFGTRLISNVARFATGQRRERCLRPKYEGTPRERFAVLASRGHFHEIVPRTKIIQSLFVRAYTSGKLFAARVTCSPSAKNRSANGRTIDSRRNSRGMKVTRASAVLGSHVFHG